MEQYDHKLYPEEDSTSQATSCAGAGKAAAPAPPAATTAHAAPEHPRKKKKRKRSQITICLSNCRYESIRKVAGAFGMREVPEDEPWNFYWTDLSVSVERAKEMKRFQRINHFPGMLEICRKDLLARNLNRMQKIYPKEYNFFPKTWCLPADLGDALSYSKSRKNKTFILKPECGSQGRGIYLTKSLKDIKPNDKLICQVYIARPFLVDGYKFDIRVYTLITSCDPLRVFVYNEGLVRFATSRYADPTVNNTTNVFMHLTNYALNKHSRTYVYDSEAGSKRKISTMNKILLSQGVDVERLWHSIDQVIVKTVIAAWPILKHSYHACFPSHDMVHACFEILGFDILLDHKLHPYILEVNHSPSFHTDTALDREVKEGLLTDTMTMLNIWQCDKRRVIDEDRRRIRDRLLHTTNKQNDVPVLGLAYYYRNADQAEEKDAEKSPWQAQIQWEETHLGNYRRVYPVGEQYASLFLQPSGSLYTNTASSRARGDCARQQREEFLQNKAKADALRQVGKATNAKPSKEPAKKSSEESTVTEGRGARGPGAQRERERARADKPPDKKTDARNAQPAPQETSSPGGCGTGGGALRCNVLCSFEPEPIVAREERERTSLLAQRDFLVRSYGLLEHIYTVLKKIGTLRPEDERKYGVYGRTPLVAQPQPQKTSATTKHSSFKLELKDKRAVKDKDIFLGEAVRVRSEEAILCARVTAAAAAAAEGAGDSGRTTRTHLVRKAYTMHKLADSRRPAAT